ncbi:unnamed protein product [Mycena citricolor]|uniref:Transmembrane protein 135 N-terminal domain-containing protein n=1 Tax=Mycena citricolor TaxID=2018698 RepID=A0AAD2GVI1_9AGAR|nr:unnamed protein product [Mycena citricolor]
MDTDSEKEDMEAQGGAPYGYPTSCPISPEPEDFLELAPHRPMPRRAMESFENLVALANYQERLKGARKVIWRDKGQPVVQLKTLRDCVEHASTGGFRAATLAFNIRASLNLVLALIRIRKVPRDDRLTLIRHAVFGADSLRFAAMLGTFAGLYKFLLNALPILLPAIKPREPSAFGDDDEEEDEEIELPAPGSAAPRHRQRSARLSASAHAQMVLVRKRTRRWHAALAGAISASLAILWEKRGRRVIIAQQLFVRGMQGTYNSYSERHHFKIPFGSVIVFALACGQIMYSFTMRPDTLPHSYINWIHTASKVPRAGVQINRAAVRNGEMDLAALDKIIAQRDTTHKNLSLLMQLRDDVMAGRPFPLYAPCATIHPAVSSCWTVPLDRFVDVFRWMLPIYSALHFLPAILFRWKMFRADPGRVLVRAGAGSLRSSAFLGVFVVIYQANNCLRTKLWEKISRSQPSAG